MHPKPNWQIILTLKWKWYNYWSISILPQLVLTNLTYNQYPNSYAFWCMCDNIDSIFFQIKMQMEKTEDSLLKNTIMK
jgi:hypothetical protein